MAEPESGRPGLSRLCLISLLASALVAIGVRMLRRTERRRAAGAASVAPDIALRGRQMLRVSPTPPPETPPPPATPAPKPAQYCNATADAVIGNVLLSKPQVSSPGACCAACAQRKRCLAWSWVPARVVRFTNRPPECQLKGNTHYVGKGPEPGWFSGVLSADRPNDVYIDEPWNQLPNCSLHRGRVLGHGTLGVPEAVQSEGDCCQLCALDWRCRAFTVADSGGKQMCFMKHNDADLGEKANRTSGRVVWRPPPAPTPAPTVAPTPQPTPAPPPLPGNLDEQVTNGFHGAVSVRSGLSECPVPGGEGWVAHEAEVGGLGPLVYRGGCRWSLVGSAFCTPKGNEVRWLCAKPVLEEQLRNLSDPSVPPPACHFGSSREPPQPAHTGAIELVRTPSSAPLINALPGEYPLRLDWCGPMSSWAMDGYALESEGDGSWYIEPDKVLGDKGIRAQIVGQKVPYISIALEKKPLGLPVGRSNRIRFRSRITTKHGAVMPENIGVLAWSFMAGDQRKAVEDELMVHLVKDQQSAVHGRQLNYEIKIQGRISRFPPRFCRQIFSANMVILPPPRQPKLLRSNLAHWTYEGLFILFSARVGPGELLGMWLTDDWENWIGMAQQSPVLREAVTKLAPSHHLLGVQTCMHRARLHQETGPPRQYALRGMRRLMRGALALPPEPLPAPKGARLTLTMLLRRDGGSRFIANWKEAAEEAGKLGWDVLFPLDPRKPNGTSFTRHLGAVALATGRSHAVLAIHGAELAVGAFGIPAGSAIVEVCTGGPYMRFADLWYANYGFSNDLHIMRWVLPAEATNHSSGQGVAWPFPLWQQWTFGPRPGAKAALADRFPVDNWHKLREAVKRAPSNTWLPMDGWRRLLGRLRKLLEAQHLGVAKPLPVRNLDNLLADAIPTAS
eukprot:TRINITY_DN16051_c0_g1_i1.p1 TRINITY_DN16051_c0_g1~~TRINITY_DN16051_c0_g1_i1.p1  ORF type:complete len:903 (+),score=182.06 TRINITY_DN16051_c0_g1_i1:104-2812(+)